MLKLAHTSKLTFSGHSKTLFATYLTRLNIRLYESILYINCLLFPVFSYK